MDVRGTYENVASRALAAFLFHVCLGLTSPKVFVQIQLFKPSNCTNGLGTSCIQLRAEVLKLFGLRPLLDLVIIEDPKDIPVGIYHF